MLQLDIEKVNRVLKQVIENLYPWIKDKENIYVSINSVEFDFAIDDTGKIYVINGCYGYRPTTNELKAFENDFNCLFDTSWSWDFLAGYFTASIVEHELEK